MSRAITFTDRVLLESFPRSRRHHGQKAVLLTHNGRNEAPDHGPFCSRSGVRRQSMLDISALCTLQDCTSCDLPQNSCLMLLTGSKQVAGDSKRSPQLRISQSGQRRFVEDLSAQKFSCTAVIFAVRGSAQVRKQLAAQLFLWGLGACLRMQLQSSYTISDRRSCAFAWTYTP